MKDPVASLELRTKITDRYAASGEFTFEQVEDIYRELCYLTLQELTQVEAAFEAGEGFGDITHDIFGLARCYYGPKYHADTFLARVVGR